MATQLYIGTERGLFTIVEGRRGWKEAHATLTNRRIAALDYDHARSNLLYIAVDNEGIYTSSDAGDSTIYRVGGDAHCVHVRRDAPKTIYAGMDRALLWASGDGGMTWEKLDSIRELWGTPEELVRMHRPDGVVRAVAGAGGNKYGIIAGLNPQGVALSPDNGHLWDFAPGSPRGIRSFAAHPQDAFYLAAASDEGVAISTDSGQHWQRPAEGLPAGPAAWVSVTATDLYTAIGGTLYRATQRAARWRAIDAPQVEGMTAVVADDSDVQAKSGLFFGTREGSILRSRDNGASWEESLLDFPPITCLAVTRD